MLSTINKFIKICLPGDFQTTPWTENTNDSNEPPVETGKTTQATGSSEEEKEVRQLLGPKVVDCLLEAVDGGDLNLQQAEYLARGLHPTAGGNFKRAKELPNFLVPIRLAGRCE